MMIRFAIGAVVLVGVLLTLVGTRPSRFKVARSITIDAPPEAVFAEVNDFHHWKAWNPWAAMDPAMRETYEGASAGVGAV
jgi:polyketide cyclase/dehydrase/lipid transport protein